MRGIARAAGCAGLAAFVLLAGQRPALAHNRLVATDPPAGARLATAPGRVMFTFAEPVQESDEYDAITVTGPGMTRWEVTGVKVYGDTISATVGALGPAGTYTLGYRIVSADGHPTTGAITVTLTRPGGGTPMAAMAEPARPSTGGLGGRPAWLWLAGLALLGCAALAAVRASGRREAR
ncbi:copper resistance CopC family protein [Actinomadura atramentaria]|uniref:copper resistance CopC family protein n=1 Tax=Actinomadura atramentaria TaxID=1990 RepID=UPI0003673793|nr:copper resistance CopC family protein [Actinomadura atramentaria]